MACNHHLLYAQYVLPFVLSISRWDIDYPGRCACRPSAGEIVSSRATAFAEVDCLGRCYLEPKHCILPRSSYRADYRTRHRHTRGRLYLTHFDALGFTTVWRDGHVWPLAFSLPSSESRSLFITLTELRRNAIGHRACFGWL